MLLLWIKNNKITNFIFAALVIWLCWGTACKMTGEMATDCNFFLGVWHSVNSSSVSIMEWPLYSSSIQPFSVSNENLALHWRQNSFPDITLIFLVFSCYAIWRVITCSPLILQGCFINTPQRLLSLLLKISLNICSECTRCSSFLLHI